MMNEKIKDFVANQTCVTICCVDKENNPYCFTCFYAFNSVDGLLYYKSSVDTQHSINILSNPQIAGTILPDKLNLIHLKGVQFEGDVLSVEQSDKIASSLYHKKYPMAIAMPGKIWTVQINSIKFTDNSLGFGKKILWKRNETIA